MNTLQCPDCANQDQSMIMGHEERGVYDGVLWWECLHCAYGWPRYFGPHYQRRFAKARQCVEFHNKMRQETFRAARTGMAQKR